MAISDIIPVLAANLAIMAGCGVLLWLVSVQLRNASIIDIFWGPFCALPAIITLLAADGARPRDVLLTALVTFWAARLGLHLATRNIGHGEDYRYVAMRKKQGSDQRFAWWSLVFVFLMQPLIAWFVSLPVQAGQLGPDRPLGILAALGGVVFIVGLAFEAIGDEQLRRFKSKPENKGRLMTEGLWAWTRHPNYFGDALVWFGLAVIALEGPFGWVGAASPFVMAHFLMNVSGKALLERAMSRKYREYDAYVARTSGFFPMPPKRA